MIEHTKVERDYFKILRMIVHPDNQRHHFHVIKGVIQSFHELYQHNIYSYGLFNAYDHHYKKILPIKEGFWRQMMVDRLSHNLGLAVDEERYEDASAIKKDLDRLINCEDVPVFEFNNYQK